MRNDTNKPELVKDLLITHYAHLSRLWEWRDRLRTSFLRYYFLVLGGVIIVIGYTARSKNESISSLQFCEQTIVRVLLGFSFIVGFPTFLSITPIRHYNLRIIRLMNNIAKWIDDYDPRRKEICNKVTEPFMRPIFRLKGIDFGNFLMLMFSNSAILTLAFYNYGIFESWQWLVYLFVMTLSLHIFYRIYLLLPGHFERREEELSPEKLWFKIDHILFKKFYIKDLFSRN